jgi:opacity protein-like surface antigen
MKKTNKRIIFLFILFSLTTTTSFAENDPYYIGLSIGPVFEQLDETLAKNYFKRSTTLDFDNAFGFQLRAGYIKNEYLTGEAVLEYVFPFESNRQYENVELDVLHFAIQSKIMYPQPGSLHPYALLGMGLMNSNMKATINFDNSNIEETEWGLSTKLGAGVDIYITPNVFSHVEMAWTKGMGNVDHIQYPAFIFGGNYRF